jgi:hypothetical protein
MNTELFFYFRKRVDGHQLGGTVGGEVVTSTEHTEGHDTTGVHQISDEGITTDHGTFVVDTGDVGGHKSSGTKQYMSGGKVTEDTLMRRIEHVGNDILKLDKHDLCMFCYKDPDPEERLKVTVKLGRITHQL